LLAGPLPPRDARLIGLFQEARAVILPSVSETFGLVILESWAAGTPVLSSRTSGALALVKEGRNGWLFDLALPESFQHAATQLFQDPARARTYGAAGRAVVAADYDTRALARRMRQLYEELIAESHALRHSPR
jgi:glycosyltransferase involved in cell wall biosynthesis